MNLRIGKLKKIGWIKPSALDEAREYYENLRCKHNLDKTFVPGHEVDKLRELYLKAISELSNNEERNILNRIDNIENKIKMFQNSIPIYFSDKIDSLGNRVEYIEYCIKDCLNDR